MSTLRELTQEYQMLLDMALDSDCDPEVIADTLEAIDGELEIKADSYAVVIAELEAKSKLIAEEQKRLRSWKSALDNNIDRIKKNLEASMRITGKMKFKTDLHSFGIQKNPASVVVSEDIDMDTVPPEYLVFSAPTLDKNKVKEDLKKGETFEWAWLEQSESLRIR